MQQWKTALDKAKAGWKPFMQSLYVDLLDQDNAIPTPIHLGFRSGTDYLNTFLKSLEAHGVNHVILNLKYGSKPASEMIEMLGEKVVPNFS